jgi:hypothetical protein
MDVSRLLSTKETIAGPVSVNVGFGVGTGVDVGLGVRVGEGTELSVAVGVEGVVGVGSGALQAIARIVRATTIRGTAQAFIQVILCPRR